MEKRTYGKTNEKLSILGFGGIIVTNQEQRDADNFVAEALDRGINYFDVSPTYGNAEVKLGSALAGKREKVFLACKTRKRSGKEAEEELFQSLKNLKTDWLDLYQMHAVTTKEDVETILSPGGALETFVKAREKGLVRHLGFSAHSEEAAIALLEQFNFDSVLFPINWISMLKNSFGVKIMEKAKEKGAARMALKVMAKTNAAEGGERKYPKGWYKPIDDKELAVLALRYSLSQSITAAIPPGDIRLFRWALDAAESFTPITPNEEAFLKEKSREYPSIFL